MQLPILELINVCYHYPDGTIAVKNLSLKIERGKKIALLGNNGAGKSTLFLLFNGILKLTSGEIVFNGRKLLYSRSEMKQLRQQVGIVFQNPDAQLFSATVYEDIKFGLVNKNVPSQEMEQLVEETMRLTETEAIKDRPPHLLSMGQKKRVALAGIVVMEPQLMVLDEPTAGLDPYYTKKIFALLNQLHDQQRTMIVSTHDVNLAYEWADELIIMNAGEVMAQGCPKTIFQNKQLLQQCHLEQPWIMEVFEQLQQSKARDTSNYPKSKKDLFSHMNCLLP